MNDMIRLSPVRLIDENNEQVGVVETDEAKQRARTAGLDLVEVAPQARPPVCRIMDYGKWKYQQRKKEQKAKSHAKQSELKGIRLRPGTDEHDLEIKTNKAREFLDDGDKVQFTMLFRGRQMAHQDLGLRSMQSIYQGLSDIAKIEAAPRMMGRRMTMVLAPDRKSHQQSKPQASKPKEKKPSAPQQQPPQQQQPSPAPADQEAEPAKSS
ncbi:translation initiation factor IF-3 [Phycisphaerales bacterium AB-hyl4]|uniref:Translation initiation factor IF-3 n=1 Tax=Natronomicrosphaera hydrolytica TaxID=3242702 RepID=A0ABV4UAS1_9BACT